MRKIIHTTKEDLSKEIISEGYKPLKKNGKIIEGYYVNPEAKVIKVISDTLEWDVKIMRLDPKAKNNAGYVLISIDGHAYTLHTIVAETFLGKIEGKEVDHIDSDKTNNKLSNLQLISHKDNCIKSRKQRGYIKPDFSNGKYSIKNRALMINGSLQPMEPKDYILYRRSKGLETYKHERLFKKLELL